MKRFLFVIVSVFTLSALNAREFKDVASAQAAQINRVSNDDITLELPRFVFSHTNTKIAIKFKNPVHDKLVSNGYKLHFIVNGGDQLVEFDQQGAGNLNCVFKADNKLSVLFENASFTKELSVISIWYMVLPLVGLFLFLGYRLAFARRKMKIVSTNKNGENAAQPLKASNLKVVKEEEVLV
ncbi:MAG TPA: hypothetical protein VNZ49_11480 [Bacteroidia bacterium]|jgi:hypothetical protein|nr:hypothetical protein [Bacteroidia bacterium]